MSSSSLKASVKLINEKYSVGLFQEALQHCDEALKTDQVFILYAMQGHCALGCNQLGDAEKSFMKATEYATTPENQPQMQKVWKSLSDMYSDSKRPHLLVNALMKLVEFASEKGNLERVAVLLENVVAAMSSMETVQPSHLTYLLTHADKMMEQHVVVAVRILAPFHSLAAKCYNQSMKSEPKSLSGAKSTVEDASVVRKQQVLELLSSAGQLLHQILAAPSPLSEEIAVHSLSLSRLCVCHLHLLRSKVLKKETATATSWQLVIDTALLAYKFAHQDCHRDIFDFVSEAWMFVDDIAFESIADIVNEVLILDPDNIAALTCDCVRGISNGMAFSKRHSIEALLTYWVSSTKDSTLNAFVASLQEKLNEPLLLETMLSAGFDSSYVFQVTRMSLAVLVSLSGLQFVDFRGMNDATASSATFQALRLLSKVQIYCGEPRCQLNTLLALARVKALSVVSAASATKEALVLLPDVFTRTGGLAVSLQIADETVPNSVAVRWAALLVLMSLRSFDEGLRYVDILIAKDAGLRSWGLVEKAWMLVHKVVETALNLAAADVTLWRDVDLMGAGGLAVDLEPAIALLQEALASVDSVSNGVTAAAHLRLGICYWLTGGGQKSDKGGSLASLLCAAKIDPNLSAVYTWLGHYYGKLMKDKERGLKCYLKALSLDPLSWEAGTSCSQLHIEDSQPEKAFKLWSDIQKLSAQALWMYVVKGRYYATVEMYAEAIVAYQIALELSPEYAALWIGLGYCYSMLRQDSAALKTLTKALELNPGNVVVLITLGDVERRLGLIVSSKARYTEVLSTSPDHVVALKGLGDCALIEAFQCNTLGWTGGAVKSISAGVAYVEKAIAVDPSIQSLWKLLGDLCSFAYNIPAYDFNFQDTLLDEPNFDCITEYLDKAERAYRQSLSLCMRHKTNEESLADGYYDIGNCLYQKARLLMQSRGQGSGFIKTAALLRDDVLSILTNAREGFSSGIQANPLHSLCWNGLGVCLLDPTLQRACFIRAVQIDGSGPGYANMGASLLFNGQDDVARDCYAALQQVETNPIYWVGLGSIFERQSGESSGIDAKVFDSFASAIEVAKPTEAYIGQALSWLRMSGILRSNNELDNSEGVRCSPSEVLHNLEHPLSVYLRKRPVSPTVWALYSWALCFRGEYCKAVRSLRRALWALDRVKSYIRIEDETELVAVISFHNSISNWMLRCEVLATILQDGSLSQDVVKYRSCFDGERPTALNAVLIGAVSSSSPKGLRGSAIASCCSKVSALLHDSSVIDFLLNALHTASEVERNDILVAGGAVADSFLSSSDEVRVSDSMFSYLLLVAEHMPVNDGRRQQVVMKLRQMYPNSVVLSCTFPDCVELEYSKDVLTSVVAELSSSWSEYEVGFASAFHTDNMRNGELSKLYALAAISAISDTSSRGLCLSPIESKAAWRSLFLCPDVKAHWLRYAVATISSWTLVGSGSYSAATLALVDFIVEKVSHEALGSLEQSWKVFSEIRSRLAVGSGSEALKNCIDWLQRAMASGKFLEIESGLWSSLSIVYSVLGSSGDAVSALEKALEKEVSSSSRSPLSVLAMELEMCLLKLSSYKVSNDYAVLASIRTKVDELQAQHSDVAAIAVVRAYIWLLLKKQPKVDECVVEAQTKWPPINVSSVLSAM